VSKFQDLYSQLNLENLDPVGHEDADINNDGKVNSTDKYLAKKREAISKAIAKGKQEEEEQLKKMEHNMHGDALYVWHYLLHSKKYSPQDAMKVLNLAKGSFEHLL
jgi:hypothetical protein